MSKMSLIWPKIWQKFVKYGNIGANFCYVTKIKKVVKSIKFDGNRLDKTLKKYILVHSVLGNGIIYGFSSHKNFQKFSMVMNSMDSYIKVNIAINVDFLEKTIDNF